MMAGRALEFERALAGRRILVTGHTGFTGGWLAIWLDAIGCETVGVALAPTTNPNMFTAAGIGDIVDSRLVDIRDAEGLREIVAEIRPDIVFHLAAQPLVSRSYADPLESFAVNVLGTANVLEAARNAETVRGVVTVTTDKVYADRNWTWGYRENDRLGGKDPYSASKACAELVASCYRQTMTARANGMGVAVARGGNIIGGGDWSDDRIVPDFYRALAGGAPLALRNPDAVRPWQHVLALVHGYLVLAAGLLAGDERCNDEFNFGPSSMETRSVRELVEALAARWRRPIIEFGTPSFVETKFLQLDSTKAQRELGWSPPLDFDGTVEMTAEWYDAHLADPRSARTSTRDQIARYRARLAG